MIHDNLMYYLNLICNKIYVYLLQAKKINLRYRNWKYFKKINFSLSRVEVQYNLNSFF